MSRLPWVRNGPQGRHFSFCSPERKEDTFSEMINFFVLCLAAYGITFALRDGKVPWITKPLCRLKFFEKMFECVFCTGTEAGWFLSAALLVRPERFDQWWELGLEVFLLGLAVGTACMILESALELQDGLLTYVFGLDGSEAYPGPEAVESPEEKK
jgi:hypothetical protein